MSANPAAFFTVRKMAAADIDQVMALASTLNDAPHWPQSAYIAALQPSSTPRRIAIVAANATGDIAGFAVASLLPPQAELESIGVRANFQRQGIGTKLLSHLIDELKAAAVSEILLEVRASNHTGNAFYLAHGFRQIGLRPRYYAEPEDDAILMSLALG
jgi:ribosomal-protein-alanine N-acetyltransferase